MGYLVTESGRTGCIQVVSQHQQMQVAGYVEQHQPPRAVHEELIWSCESRIAFPSFLHLRSFPQASGYPYPRSVDEFPANLAGQWHWSCETRNFNVAREFERREVNSRWNKRKEIHLWGMWPMQPLSVCGPSFICFLQRLNSGPARALAPSSKVDGSHHVGSRLIRVLLRPRNLSLTLAPISHHGVQGGSASCKQCH